MKRYIFYDNYNNFIPLIKKLMKRKYFYTKIYSVRMCLFRVKLKNYGLYIHFCYAYYTYYTIIHMRNNVRISLSEICQANRAPRSTLMAR